MNGLSHNTVMQILQDSKGFLWFTTGNGLCKYDGYNFEIFRKEENNKFSIPNNRTEEICEDINGNIWISMPTGISKIDTRTNKVIINLDFFSQEVGLGDIETNYLFGDYNADIWFGTDKDKVFCLKQDTKKLISYSTDNAGNNFEFILRISRPSPDQMLEILTTKGRFLYNETKDEFIRDEKINAILEETNAALSEIFYDSKGNEWIALKSYGVIRFNKDAGKKETFLTAAQTDYKSSPSIHVIKEDLKGNLWLGTGNNGLFYFDYNNEQFYHYKHDISKPKGLNDNQITDIYVDKTNVLWIATTGSGLNKIDLERKNFKVIESSISNPNSLTENSVFGLCEDRKGNIWIGTKSGSVNKYVPETGAITRYPFITKSEQTITGFKINEIIEDSIGNIWMTSWYGTVVKMNPGTGEIYRYSKDNSDLAGWAFTSCAAGKDGKVWISSTHAGVEFYHPKDGKFHQFPLLNNQGDTILPIILKLQIIDQDKLMIGTENHGLLEVNLANKKIKYFDPIPGVGKSPVKSIIKSKSGVLWMGCEKGLVKYEDSKLEGKLYTKNDGLSDNNISCIQEDANGFLWITTDFGLSKLDPVKEEFKNYFYSDGLPANVFNNNSSLYSPTTGEMFFGTHKGLLHFNPNEIHDNAYSSKVLITGFQLFDNNVIAGDTVNNRVLFNKTLDEEKKIVLTHKDYVFAIEFAALHFAAPENIQYKFRLHPFDKEWRKTKSSNRIASYSNLPHGQYYFEVKATNNDGKWSDETANIEIVVLPPFWKTWWFKLILIVTFVTSIWSIYLVRIRNLKQRQFELEQKVDERTADLQRANTKLREKQEEIIVQNEELQLQKTQIEAQQEEIIRQATEIHEKDQMKLRFFTNISHEFRTPLTLILGPIEKMLSGSKKHNPENSIHMLKLVKRNAHRMLRLITQVLDASKYEAGALKLSISQGDIIDFLKPIVQSFHVIAESKNIHYKVYFNREQADVYFDKDKVEKIIYNLLSNAFKYSGNHEEVEINIFIFNVGTNPVFKCWIRDTGIGIPSQRKERVFERFYQDESGKENSFNGTGIGLSLTKNLVNLHKGTICIESVEDKGTVFKFEVPVYKNAFENDEFILGTEQQVYQETIELNNEHKSVPNRKLDEANNKPILLLVEDHLDLRQYIAEEINEKYQVLECTNGFEALKIADENIPDLIVSDIMMPGMDGLALTEKIKSNMKTSHIPIILLTAKGSDETRLEGYDTGADSFLTKPFTTPLLLKRIENLLESRKKLRQKFSMDSLYSSVEVESPDEKFLKEMTGFLDKNLNDQDLNVEALAKLMNLNRRQLYRKVQALTNTKVSDFIKNYRLKRAEEILIQTSYTISEICYMVGFKELSHFSRSFAEVYGSSPSDYREAKK